LNSELNKYLNINNLDLENDAIKLQVKRNLVYIRKSIIEQL
jgi:hypothetical protein